MRNRGFALSLTVISLACSLSAFAEETKGSAQPITQSGQSAGSGPACQTKATIAQAPGTNGSTVTPTFTMPGSHPSPDNRMFNAGLIVTTTESVDGFRIKEYRGIVRGTMVREPTSVQNFKAGIQGMFGGKVNAYITMCEEGRQQSYDQMVQRAQGLGANAVVGVRYDSDAFSGGSNNFGTEVVCYGTAVVIEPKSP